MSGMETYTVSLSNEESWVGAIHKLRLRGPFGLDVETESSTTQLSGPKLGIKLAVDVNS